LEISGTNKVAAGSSGVDGEASTCLAA